MQCVLPQNLWTSNNNNSIHCSLTIGETIRVRPFVLVMLMAPVRLSLFSFTAPDGSVRSYQLNRIVELDPVFRRFSHFFLLFLCYILSFDCLIHLHLMATMPSTVSRPFARACFPPHRSRQMTCLLMYYVDYEKKHEHNGWRDIDGKEEDKHSGIDKNICYFSGSSIRKTWDKWKKKFKISSPFLSVRYFFMISQNGQNGHIFVQVFRSSCTVIIARPSFAESKQNVLPYKNGKYFLSCSTVCSLLSFFIHFPFLFFLFLCALYRTSKRCGKANGFFV